MDYKALASDNYDYYELTHGFGVLPAGTIFVHDKNDQERGSISNGCLVLCWTPDGNCYGGICGETVILHAAFINTPALRLVKRSEPKERTRVQKALELIKEALETLTEEQ